MTYNDANGQGWRKSSHSPDWDDCVEVGRLENGRIGFRDTKDRAGGVLPVNRRQMIALVNGLR
ncbi:DUF397 domain-containing protein [Actinomadura hibisca]|uniref:DUF397 domain-containing protein n=1 Tax=Actinomadura hibisca TaxID=68565 RepID=UPI00083386C1|nr:DUF397 domain-containing protein [Actinomadura hibisca]